MDRTEHDRRLAERLAEPLQKSGADVLVYKDHVNGPELDTYTVPFDPAQHPARPFTGTEQDDYIMGELQAAFSLQKEGILRTLRTEQATAITKLDKRLCKLEGKIDAMMAVLALTKDRLGNLKGEKGERGERGLTGRKGKDAREISGLSFDAQTLSLVAKMSDGGIGAVISLSRLFAGIEIDRKSYSLVLRMTDGTELRFCVRDLFEQYDNEKEGVAP